MTHNGAFLTPGEFFSRFLTFLKFSLILTKTVKFFEDFFRNSFKGVRLELMARVPDFLTPRVLSL